jgi:peptide/nickel transport system ATP-binding protein
MRETESLLKIKNLTVEFSSDREIIHAVNHVDIEIRKGETLGLVGETGAGKTTIAKAILRILPKPQGRIKSGEIIFNGVDMLKMSDQEIRKIRGNKISMIFQDPMSALNPVVSVGKQIAEAIKLHQNLSNTETDALVVKMLELVGIPGARVKEYPHQFSGGMKQRVIIAMALACRPELLLADEPTTALDVTIQAQVLEMMAKLKTELKTSMLLITHDLGIVAETCDMVAVIYAGEIIEYADVEELFDNPMHPYTIGLFGSLPSPDGDRGKKLKPISGMMPNPAHLPQGCKFAERCPKASNECITNEIGYDEVREGHYVRCIKCTRVEEAV